jgi:ribosomal protein S27E
MLPALLLWSPPNVFVVVRCTACQRADVRVRWPERFADCNRCGAYVFAQPPAQPSDGGAEGDETS